MTHHIVSQQPFVVAFQHNGIQHIRELPGPVPNEHIPVLYNDVQLLMALLWARAQQQTRCNLSNTWIKYDYLVGDNLLIDLRS
jgi:hypothetical protein